MVLDTARPRYKENTTWLGMRGRDAARKSTPKVNITKVFTIVFSETKSIVNRNSKIGLTEQKCIEMDELAQQDHTYRLSKEEFKRYQGQWYPTLSKNAPMRLRQDFRAAVSLENRLHRESGEEVAELISPQQYRRWHCCQAILGGTGTRPKVGGAHERSIHFLLQ